MQALKTLFFYAQGKKESMEEYGQNFRSLWDMVEAFGGSPGVHKGLMDALLTQITSAGGNPMAAQQKKEEEDSSEAVKAALLISGADRRRYGVLKDALANNYLLGNDQYPDTYDKAFRVLANYQVTKIQGKPGRYGGGVPTARGTQRPRGPWRTWRSGRQERRGQNRRRER